MNNFFISNEILKFVAWHLELNIEQFFFSIFFPSLSFINERLIEIESCVSTIKYTSFKNSPVDFSISKIFFSIVLSVFSKFN